MPHLIKLGSNNPLKLLRRLGPVLLEPIAKPMIIYQLAELANLAVERVAVSHNPVLHDVRDGMITRVAVHVRNFV